MSSARVLYQMARADFLERVRRYSFLVTLGFAVWLGYCAFSGGIVLKLGDYRGIFNSAWVGGMMTVVTTTFLSLVGFYVVRNAVERDRQTRVGKVLASTPMTRVLYTFAKTCSNFAVLASMVVVLVVAAVAMQEIRGDTSLEMGKLLAPFLVVALPSMAVVAALAVLWEVTPFLRSGAGNVLYFFVWSALLTVSVKSGIGDFAGLSIFMHSAGDALKLVYPAYRDSFTLTLGSNAPARQTFVWNGFDWTMTIVAARIAWVLVACGVTMLAAAIFDRFDAHGSGGRQTGTTEAGQQDTPIAVLSQVLPQIHLSPLSSRGSGFSFARLVLSELGLLLKGQRWWWYAVAAALAIASAVVPNPHVRAGLVSVDLIWPVLLWSQLGAREASFNTSAMVFSCPHPLAVQFPATWLSGAILSVLIGAAFALRVLAGGDVRSFAACVAGMLFIPSLALALGAWTGHSKAFEAFYTVWWYAGPANHMPGLDFFGTTPASCSPILYAVLAAALLVIAVMGRRAKLAYA
jgi:hypothetical protein